MLLFNCLLLGTVAGEFFLPWLLKHFYPGYDPRRMVMSALGSPGSPVRRVYNAWLLWLGGFLLAAAILFFRQDSPTAPILSALRLLSLAVFGVGAGLVAGLFSVGGSKQDDTPAARIHGIGAAIGFMALLFYPLLDSIAAFTQGRLLLGGVDLAAFLLALLFFIFFILADKPSLANTPLAQEGLWQRLALFFMYVPLVCRGAAGLLQGP